MKAICPIPAEPRHFHFNYDNIVLSSRRYNEHVYLTIPETLAAIKSRLDIGKLQENPQVYVQDKHKPLKKVKPLGSEFP